MDADDVLDFPELFRAARRLELDAEELAEAMLSALGSGLEYWPALHQTVVEAAQRWGIYDGETKARIDSGRVFEEYGWNTGMTTYRLSESLEDGRKDALDALAIAGAASGKRSSTATTGDFARRRAARLATTNDGEE